MGTMRHLVIDAIVGSLVILSLSHVPSVNCAVTTTLRPSENDAFVVTTTVPSSTPDVQPSPTVTLEEASVKTKSKEKDFGKPEIYSFRIQSDIRYRYTKTCVTSRVANRNTVKSQEVTFRVVLPETAFISKFLMEIDGKTYEAYVKEKEEAKNIYTQAQSQGQSAGLVEVNTRNANVFNVNVNIQAQSKVTFNLTYEELLQRRLGVYEHSINISPDQITNVKDFQILVNIEESQNITTLRVPQLRNDVEIQEDPEGNIKEAVIERPAGNKATITWRPSQADQTTLSKQGLAGKFIVQYDIKRELDAGQVLVMNGYFVHFFAPTTIDPLRKHVVFILDISGSMWGRKIEQLKEAMNKILADLTSDDFFNIITFSSDVTLWSPSDKVQQESTNNWSPPAFLNGNSRPQLLADASKRQPLPATKENIKKAQSYISALVASGGTNIHDSIVTALNLTSIIKEARRASNTSSLPEVTTTTTSSTTTTTLIPNVNETDIKVPVTTPAPTITTTTTILPNGVESLIIFLTDGEPTVGVTNPVLIQNLIQAANKNISIPIFSLAFGEGADFPFVRKLSLQNNGFARKIYEASDAALQLKGFYNEIASPLLSNVTFNYTSPEFEVGNLTLTRFATVFGGTEIVVSGTLTPRPVNETIVPSINGTTTNVVNNTKTVTEEESPGSSEVGTTTEIPRLEDSVALPKSTNNNVDEGLVSTDKYNFGVKINGYGRHGEVQLLDPEIFSSPIPWGIPVITPWPPRPTPPPTPEDTFLEKMWAYLTIKQLIDQDLATIEKENNIPVDDQFMSGEVSPTTTTTISSVTESPKSSSLNGTNIVIGHGNVTIIKETPKQRALRLALKYGFVTPLTSLVVVKPNKTSDVTDTVPSDVKPEALDSMSAPQSMAHYAFVRPLHKTAPSKFAATVNRISSGGPTNFALLPLSIQSSRPQSYPGTPSASFGGAYAPPPMSFLISGSTGAHPASSSSLDTIDYNGSSGSLEELEDHTTTATTPRPVYHPTTVKISTTPIPSTTVQVPKVVLNLKDLKWYNSTSPEVHLNQTVFKIAVNETTEDLSSYLQGGDCQIRAKDKGTCLHLRDCVQPVFLDDIELYKSSYLCPIKASSSTTTTGVIYAGVCCPTS